MIVGAIGGAGRGIVDPRGSITVAGEAWTLDWWIGADDRWRVPSREPAVRQGALAGAPVAETRVRVPSGDAVQRVYAVGGPGDVVIAEVENDSPAAFIVAFVITGATSIALEGNHVLIDDRVAMVVPFPPPRWDVTDVAFEPEQCGAETGRFEARRFASGELRAALLFPLSHRNRFRVGIVSGDVVPAGLDLAQVPAADAAARGWRVHLDRGMRVTGPTEMVEAIDCARSQVLLEPEPTPAVAAALEDWGFDEAAEYAWHGMSIRERRRARRRVGLDRDPGPAAVLLRTRDGLVRDTDDGFELLHAPPAPGIDLEVHDAPSRHGTISFALRWHGEHAALLWEVRDATGPFQVQAPVMAPGWSSQAAVGETLLRPVTA
ncbi:MAG: hypothetical protein JJE46_11165 [Acidimicrobiia bacterium]|nr:hypothetical protein [Acidimicrobiia bacterium]